MHRPKGAEGGFLITDAVAGHGSVGRRAMTRRYRPVGAGA
jgi:hypothetical protein